MEPIAMKTECGTAMCIAGHALNLAGYKMRSHPDVEAGGLRYPGRLDYDFISPSGRKVLDELKTAAGELGLEYHPEAGNKAFDLFHDFSLRTPKDAAVRIQKLIEQAQA